MHSPATAAMEQIHSPDLSDAAEIADTMGPLDKLMTADVARMLADNQRVLDLASRRAEAFSQYELSKLGTKMSDRPEDMQISIDSPVTTTHHHAAPVIPPAAAGLGKWASAAIGAGLLATGIGVPAGAWMIADAIRKPATEQVIEKVLTGDADVTVGDVTIREAQ